MSSSMWFNSDIWFELADVGQVTTYPHKTEVFTNTRDVITITFNGVASASVKRQRGDNVVVYTLGYLHVKYNLDKLIQYAKKHGIYLNVTDPREWQSAAAVEEGQTKEYKGVAEAPKTEVLRGYENLYPYPRITALRLPDGSVRLMRYGERTYKVADQVRYPTLGDFLEANRFVPKHPEDDHAWPEWRRNAAMLEAADAMHHLAEPVEFHPDEVSSVTLDADDVQEVNVPEEEGVEVGEEEPVTDEEDEGEETDDDSSSDYEPEKERGFYRVQPQSRKRRRVEKTMTIRMAVGGGDDLNVDETLVDANFQFGNMSSAWKTGKQLYRVNFQNGAYMLVGRATMTYVRPNGEAVWCEWKNPDDFREFTVWLWDQPSFQHPVVVA